jgi:hypothetical protein
MQPTPKACASRLATRSVTTLFMIKTLPSRWTRFCSSGSCGLWAALLFVVLSWPGNAIHAAEPDAAAASAPSASPGLGLPLETPSDNSPASPVPSGPRETPSSAIENSVVKVFCTARYPDLSKPWTKTVPTEVSGSGVIIDGKRILTSAHVVLYASEVQVQPNQAGIKSRRLWSQSPGYRPRSPQARRRKVLRFAPTVAASTKATRSEGRSYRLWPSDGRNKSSVTKGLCRGSIRAL